MLVQGMRLLRETPSVFVAQFNRLPACGGFKLFRAAVYSLLQHSGYVPGDVKLPDFLPLALTMA